MPAGGSSRGTATALAAAGVLLLAGFATAAEYRVRPATSEIRVDGSIDEAAWRDALELSLRFEWLPGDNTKPPVDTRAWITYDSSRLYVAFLALDPEPDKIRAHLMDRDAISTFVQDDHVTLMIDTFNDQRRAFQFRVNPLGVQADAIFSEVEGIEDFSWDIIWQSAGRIHDRGYSVEIAIPLKQLRFPRGGGDQTWGFELGRSWPRNVRHRISANRRDRNRNCLLCLLDKVDGFVGLEPGLNLEFDPTLTASRTDTLDRFPDGRLVAGDEDYEPGVTARWSVTPNLTLNAAVDPDFSQVEADAAQLDVNTRFALFFPEKRPFFLEGADIFATPFSAVFTRTIGDMDYGGKLTGKQGPHAFGVFFATDGEPPALVIPGNQFSNFAVLDGAVDTGVLRYRHDVGRNSTLGVLVTGREGNDYHNRVGGIDGFFRLNKANTLRFQYLRSDTEYPDAIAAAFGQDAIDLDDDAYGVEYDFASRHWSAGLGFEDRGRGFRADSGFEPRVDTVAGEGFVARTWWGDADDWYTSWNLGLFSRRVEDHDGRLTDQTIDLFANFNGPLQSFVEVSLQRDEEYLERFPGDPRAATYSDLNRVQMFGTFQPGSWIKTDLFVDLGDTVDRLNSRPAEVLLLNPVVEMKLGRHVNARLDHRLQRLDVAGGELFEAQLSQLRLVYQISVRMFVRAILQRQKVTRDLALIDVCADDPAAPPCPFAAEEEDLFTQILFSYKLNPQTVIFVGYSDGRTDHFNDGFGVVRSGSPIRTQRTFFLKLGYAWTL